MTRLVARQCRLLRAPHAAARPVWSLQRPATAVLFTAAVRSYAHEAVSVAATAAKEEPKFPPTRRLDLSQHQDYGNRRKFPITRQLHQCDLASTHSAILIPASLTATTPQHFVDKIEPVDTHLIPSQNLAVILVTPSFASWLLDDSLFLDKALAKLYKNMAASHKNTNPPQPLVRAICAVVDKLPAARPLQIGPAISNHFTARSLTPPVNEAGFEGIAYLTLPAKAEAATSLTMSDDTACIDFTAHTHTSRKGMYSHRVRVPLANTVFQTGEPSTMINSTWEWSPDLGALKSTTRKHLKAAIINLSTPAPSPQRLLKSPNTKVRDLPQDASALSIPLVPLTLPRQVDGHMGNIIRGLIGPDGNKMTASTELEKVVPQYFTARGEPAQATSAWALVVRESDVGDANKRTMQILHQSWPGSYTESNVQDTEDHWQALWQKHPPAWNKDVQRALAAGGRLHKVLSGGGGWGKKAGLLSLDPVPVGALVKQTAKDVEEDTFDSVGEFSTALKPVVQDGDSIQFFISPTVPQGDNVSTFEQLKVLEGFTKQHVWSWEFGVVPSTVDSIPGGSWQHTAAASEDIVAFRGSFGALTEGGLTLMRGLKEDRTTARHENLGTTTIDVPFSRWSAVRMFAKAKAKNSSKSKNGAKAKKGTKTRSSRTRTKFRTNAGNPS
ncbi:hypothetical protein N0V94_009356 [Neodidymelliopsis sp. IMI 364377]|nr:hypothetical protein N0V94_009356 [Neodidymelliopsis sp. IMI 364377]